MKNEFENENMTITIKPFGDDFALGNGSDVEFILSKDGLSELKTQISRILRTIDRRSDDELKAKIAELKERTRTAYPMNIWNVAECPSYIKALDYVIGEREDL